METKKRAVVKIASKMRRLATRENLIFLAILILAAFLRFFRMKENLFFNGEVGNDLLMIRDEILSHRLSLIGPPSAHSWLSMSPFFYWLMAPFLFLSHFNPLLIGYFGAVLGVFIILVNYIVVCRFCDQKTALFSSFLISISPLWLQFAREARFLLPSLLLFYPALWTFYKKRFFLFGLFFGLMLDFHYAPLILLPGFLSYLLVKKIPLNRDEIIRSLGGFFLATIPILVCNFAYQGKMIFNFLVWIPYRIIGFMGFYPKNTVSPALVKENLSLFYRFFNLDFWPLENILMPFLLIFATGFVVYRKKTGLGLLFLLAGGLLALFIHGKPSIHYFLPLFPLPVILMSLFLSSLWVRRFGKLIVAGFLLLLLYFNLTFLFSEKWFYLPQDKIRLEPFFVPYKLQLQVAQAIVDDAHGRPYRLQRVGPFDIYENFIKNYQYLTWWLGNEPTLEETKLVYTIYEDQAKEPFFIRKEE